MKPALLAAALLTLGACGQEADRAPNPTEAQAMAAAPALPMSFTQKGPDGEVSLTLDRRIAAWPALHQRLYNEGKRELVGFMDSAKADRTKLPADERPPPYERDSKWQVAAETTRLVSLRQSWNEYTGGAHPNHGAVTLLWSKGDEAPVLQPYLFRADADFGALDAILCAAAKGAKAARLGVAAAEGPGWSCPQWKDSRAVLTPSTVAEKAGGLTFLFDPYVLGPYAEGDYEVTVPQAQFRGALKQAFVGDFEGAPMPRAR